MSDRRKAKFRVGQVVMWFRQPYFFRGLINNDYAWISVKGNTGRHCAVIKDLRPLSKKERGQ